MKQKEIQALVNYFNEAVHNPDPMRLSDKKALKKLAELYQWEEMKREARGHLFQLAKMRDKGLW